MPIPETVSYSEFREHLASYLDGVVDDSLPLVVKRKNGKKVVVISEEEYNSLDETAYLMSTKANREHLLEALADSYKPDKNRKVYKNVDEIRKEFNIK